MSIINEIYTANDGTKFDSEIEMKFYELEKILPTIYVVDDYGKISLFSSKIIANAYCESLNIRNIKNGDIGKPRPREILLDENSFMYNWDENLDEFMKIYRYQRDTGNGNWWKYIIEQTKNIIDWCKNIGDKE